MGAQCLACDQYARQRGDRDLGKHHDRGDAGGKPGRAKLQRGIGDQQDHREDHRTGQPREVVDRRGADHADGHQRDAHPGGHQCRAHAHGQRPRGGRRLAQAAQLHIQPGKCGATRHAQPVTERCGPGQPGAGLPQHDGGACDGDQRANRRPSSNRLGEQPAGKQHGPDRHEVKKKHHAKYFPCRHSPIKASVGKPCSESKYPQSTVGQKPSEGASPQQCDADATDQKDNGGRPEPMQTPLREIAQRPPRQAPDRGIEQQREQRGSASRGHGAHAPSQSDQTSWASALGARLEGGRVAVPSAIQPTRVSPGAQKARASRGSRTLAPDSILPA